MSKTQQQGKKISVDLVLGWIFGVLFAFNGIIFVFSELVPGIVMLAMAAVLLPPINKLVDKKLKFHLSGGMKIVVIIIGLIIFGATIETPTSEVRQIDQLKSGIALEEVEQESISEQAAKKITENKTQEKPPQTEAKAQPVVTQKEEIATQPVKETKAEPEPQPTETIKSDSTTNDSIIENHCQSDWPNDANMKAYCKKEQYSGLATLNRGKPTDITDSQFLIIREHCKNDWPTDFSMRAYCEKEQYDGVRTLNNGRPSDIGTSEFNIIRPKCESDWPTDFSMRAYCEKEQYDAVRTLNNTSAESYKRNQCANEWPTDFSMRVYCENN